MGNPFLFNDLYSYKFKYTIMLLVLNNRVRF
jgi:hypothetical protein